MTLHWFRVPRFDTPADALEAMAPFGVTLLTPISEPAHFYWDPDANGVLVNAGIHRVYDDGRIMVRPYSCLSTALLASLIAAAGNAFERKASASYGWNRRRKSKTVPEPYWWSRVVMRADQDPIAELVRAARRDAPAPTTVTELTAERVRQAPHGNPTLTRWA